MAWKPIAVSLLEHIPLSRESKGPRTDYFLIAKIIRPWPPWHYKLVAQEMYPYPVGTTPEQFDAHIRSEMAKYAKVIKEAGIKVD
jgi:hypothetical protein